MGIGPGASLFQWFGYPTDLDWDLAGPYTIAILLGCPTPCRLMAATGGRYGRPVRGSPHRLRVAAAATCPVCTSAFTALCAVAQGATDWARARCASGASTTQSVTSSLGAAARRLSGHDAVAVALSRGGLCASTLRPLCLPRDPGPSPARRAQCLCAMAGGSRRRGCGAPALRRCATASCGARRPWPSPVLHSICLQPRPLCLQGPGGGGFREFR